MCEEKLKKNSHNAILYYPRLEARYGACDALASLGGAAAPAVPALRKTLRHPDLWLRVKAADALAAIGRPAMETLPEILEMLAKGPTDQDPRGMEQRFLCFAVFDKMLRNPLDGVNRDQLRKAVAAALRNEDGRARGSVGGIFKKLDYGDIAPLLPAIRDAITTPAPSGEMFAAEIQMAGLSLFAKFHISQGIELLADYARTQNPWASQDRIVEIMKLLKTYGAHAQRVIPKLEAVAHYFEFEEKDFPRELGFRKVKSVRETIEVIQASAETPDLIEL